MSKRLVVAVVATFAVLLVLDLTWLISMADVIYRPYIGALLADEPNLIAAAAFYVLYTVGLTIFVLRPALAEGTSGALKGGLFGLVAYGAYDLTNHATLIGWSGVVTVADMGWGMSAGAIACGAGVWISRKITA